MRLQILKPAQVLGSRLLFRAGGTGLVCEDLLSTLGNLEGIRSFALLEKGQTINTLTRVGLAGTHKKSNLRKKEASS